MFELLGLLVRLVAAFPLPVLGAVWMLSARRARAMAVGGWWLGPFALLFLLYSQRRHLAGFAAATMAVLLGVMWTGALVLSSDYRFAVGVAVPFAAAGCAWWTLVTRYPTLPVWQAARVWWLARQHQDDLRPAVKAAAGDGARLVRDSVRVTADGAVEAEIIGPAGVSHADLVEGLRDSLAESVLAVSGRVLKDVAVTGAGAKGRVLVRCSTRDPYERSMTLREVLGR